MAHQCPKCELKFTWQTELDDHCRTDHPEFHHDYPSSAHYDFSARPIHVAGEHPYAAPAEEGQPAKILSTYWNER